MYSRTFSLHLVVLVFNLEVVLDLLRVVCVAHQTSKFSSLQKTERTCV